jgi:hypothetical protein
VEKRFQVWRTTTVDLLLNSTNKDPDNEANRLLQWKAEIFHEVEDVIGGCRRPNSDGYKQEFLRILDEALELDKEINKQVARVQLVFESEGSNSVFDPSMMELEKGEELSGSKREAFLVTSPAVVKRGKSNGESFSEVALLLA